MIKFNVFRSYTYSIVLRRGMCNKPSPSPPENNPMGSISARYRPSDLQKFILVWTKKFKSKEEIPKFVSYDLIERSRSEARIKLANWLMLLTVLGSLGAIMSGKAAAKRGESIHQLNLNWHKQYQDEHKENEPSK